MKNNVIQQIFPGSVIEELYLRSDLVQMICTHISLEYHLSDNTHYVHNLDTFFCINDIDDDDEIFNELTYSLNRVVKKKGFDTSM